VRQTQGSPSFRRSNTKCPNEKYACGGDLHALVASGAPLATGLATEPGRSLHPEIAAGPAPPIYGTRNIFVVFAASQAFLIFK